MKQRGFTLLEMLVATLIMGMAVIGLMAELTASMRHASRAGPAVARPHVAGDLVDGKRRAPHFRAKRLPRARAARRGPAAMTGFLSYNPSVCGAGSQPAAASQTAMWGRTPVLRGFSRTRSACRPGRRPQDWSPAPQSGITLIEVVIAVTLLSMLSVGMLATLRMGFDGLHKTNSRLMENRRVAGAQRVIEQQLGGFMPVKAPIFQTTFTFFEGQPQSMRLVSTYSLQEAWRGQPRILELQVIPGDEGRGVRLIVNEIPYTSPV